MLHQHAVVRGPSKFGARNVFHPFTVIGGDPQDYTFAREHVELVAGRWKHFSRARDDQPGNDKRAEASRGLGTRIFFWRTRTWDTIARWATTRCS